LIEGLAFARRLRRVGDDLGRARAVGIFLGALGDGAVRAAAVTRLLVQHLQRQVALLPREAGEFFLRLQIFFRDPVGGDVGVADGRRHRARRFAAAGDATALGVLADQEAYGEARDQRP